MSEVSFEQMLEDSFKTIHNGEVLTGKVIDVKPNEAIINIGYKTDGVLPINEYSMEEVSDLTTELKVGDEIEVKVLKLNDSEGQVLLSHKRISIEKVNEKLKEAFENEEVISGTVKQILSGGLIAVSDGTKFFIPASLVSDVFERDLSKYKDQDIEFKITEFNPRRNRLIGNRRIIVEAEKKARKEEVLSKIAVGDTIEGKVKNITKFGAFVDIGGVDGLLHISEMSWKRIDDPKKVVSIDDTVKVFIKDIKDDKIALSMKFPEENPWNKVADKLVVGNVIKGKVVRMTDFGAFVEIADDVDGLLHISQIAKQHINKPSDVLKIGEEVETKVIDFNRESHKISLSIKSLIYDRENEAKAKEAKESFEETENHETVYSDSDEATTIDVPSVD